MKAVGYSKAGSIDEPNSLIDLHLPDPSLGAQDLLVRVQAVSVNPVDTKVRWAASPPAGEFKVLGWDACGLVEHVGPVLVILDEQDLERPGAVPHGVPLTGRVPGVPAGLGIGARTAGLERPRGAAAQGLAIAASSAQTSSRRWNGLETK